MKITRKPNVHYKLNKIAAVTGLTLLMTTGAQAKSFDISDEIVMDWDTQITYSAGYRLDDPNKKNIAPQWANEDDGNRNFDKGLMQNRLNIISEIDISSDNFGVFVRGNFYYDAVYEDKNTANDNMFTYNSGIFNGGSVAHTEFPKDTKKQHGSDFELWDAFVYGSFDLGDRRLTLRAGRQVISWGESIFVPNGINFANVPLDSSRLNIPGVQLKEVFRPVLSIYAQIDITDNLSLETYYQYEWEKNKVDAVGSYFSTVDFLDEGGENILVPATVLAQSMTGMTSEQLAMMVPWVFPSQTLSPFATIDRVDNREPSNDGQYGVALRYLAENLNDTEFGFYLVNYHEKSPMFTLRAASGLPNVMGAPGAPVLGSLDTNWMAACGASCAPGAPGAEGSSQLAGALMGVETSSYFLDYAEDIKLYGISASSVLGDTNVAVEFSLRQDMPIVTSSVLEGLPSALMGIAMGQAAPGVEVLGYSRANVTHTDISVLHFFGPTVFADNFNLTFEAAYDRVNGLEDDQVGSSLQPADRSAWGYQMQMELGYNRVMPNLDLIVPITFKQDFGDSVFLSGGFKDNQKSFNIGVSGIYASDWVIQLKYTSFMGDKQRNLLDDRDFVSFSLGYSF